MKDSSTIPPVLLYDGVCGFCNKAVQTVIKHDRAGLLRFAALQSDYGKAVLARHPQLANIDSLALLEQPPAGPERVAIRSTAALRVASYLSGAWKLALVFYVLPRPVRDRLYDLFARHRYQLFGKSESCMLPPPEMRSRFLDSAESTSSAHRP